VVVEYIRYQIPQERQETFEAGYRDAAGSLEASEHCLSYDVTSIASGGVRASS
jgi:hemoglobin